MASSGYSGVPFIPELRSETILVQADHGDEMMTKRFDGGFPGVRWYLREGYPLLSWYFSSAIYHFFLSSSEFNLRPLLFSSHPKLNGLQLVLFQVSLKAEPRPPPQRRQLTGSW